MAIGYQAVVVFESINKKDSLYVLASWLLFVCDNSECKDSSLLEKEEAFRLRRGECVNLAYLISDLYLRKIDSFFFAC